MAPGSAYLDQELRGGIGGHNSTGHFQADSVQLLNLSPPDLSKSPASTVHLHPSGPVTLKAEGEASLISELPANSTDEELSHWLLSRTRPLNWELTNPPSSDLKRWAQCYNLAYLSACFDPKQC